jgi:cytochrome c oxidase cbb3-type subunit 2
VQLTLNDRLEAYTPKRAGRLVLLLTRRTEELLAAAGGAFTLITPGPRGFAMAAYLQSLGAHTWKERLRMLDSSGGDHAIAASSSEAPAALLQRGREVYERNCTGCHGARGEGDGLAAIFFEFKPRNFTTTNFKLRSTPPGEFPTDQDLFRAITRGMPGTAMPPWRELPELDRWGLVHYVKLLARQGLREYFRSLPPEERVGEEELEQIVRDRTTPTRTIPVSVPVAADAAAVERGKGLFEKLGCGQCHGKDLKGRSREEGFDWTDEAGRFLPRSADLTAGVFKGGAAAKDLYLRLMSGMNVGPMPSFEAGLPSEEDRWSLVHFLVSLSREK